MNRIATLPVDSNGMYAEIDIYKRTKKQAVKEYWKQIKEAFNGEIVICYDNNMIKGYPDIMPQVIVSKKRDWRYGKDNVSEEHRKQYLKYKYLGKIN